MAVPPTNIPPRKPEKYERPLKSGTTDDAISDPIGYANGWNYVNPHFAVEPALGELDRWMVELNRVKNQRLVELAAFLQEFKSVLGSVLVLTSGIFGLLISFLVGTMSISGNSSDRVCENGIQHVELLPATNDLHGGVIVDMKDAMDAQHFLTLLRASISQWRREGKKGVWIKLPIELVNLVETAVKEGFRYHHAEPHYLMLVYWIPETTNTLPANASHRVSVGAIVVNDKKEMLVVQEKSGRFQGTGVWKIPTGVVDEGEDIFKAAVREVKEETGVSSQCLSIYILQSHKSFFEKSDLSFVCMLHPQTFDIEKQELEIEAAKWMPLEEYAAQPVTQTHALFKYILELGLAKLDRDYAGFSPLHITSVFDDKLSFLYLNRAGDAVPKFS
ncbi:hypothetical protein GBA52_014616 [Prunus armeniaca]|nr:hypothetical protein GBA52_014616 [Prunus armeniaca]